MVHVLKVHRSEFDRLLLGLKTHEWRRDDRTPRFAEGDELVLLEWDPKKQERTGRGALLHVTHVSRDAFGLPAGFCVMSVKLDRAFPNGFAAVYRTVDLAGHPDLVAIDERARRGEPSNWDLVRAANASLVGVPLLASRARELEDAARGRAAREGKVGYVSPELGLRFKSEELRHAAAAAADHVGARLVLQLFDGAWVEPDVDAGTPVLEAASPFGGLNGAPLDLGANGYARRDGSPAFFRLVRETGNGERDRVLAQGDVDAVEAADVPARVGQWSGLLAVVQRRAPSSFGKHQGPTLRTGDEVTFDALLEPTLAALAAARGAAAAVRE